MASEKAKALAAQQKAERKAEQLRKRNSNDPRDWNTFRQFAEAYKVTKQYDKQLDLLLAASVLGFTVLFAIIGWFTNTLWITTFTGLLLGITLALIVLTWRAKGASYRRYAGQTGSAEVALSMLDAKKWFYTAAIAANRQLDLVHRAVGPGGVVLVSEGPAARVKPLLASEAKKHESVAFGVRVTTMMMGNAEGQVPLEQLAKQINKLPKVLQPHQVTEIKQRLKALDAVRPKVPLPRGPLPSVRGLNRAMRGR